MILDEFSTILHLLGSGRSIARYGDGELKLCVGKPAISQPPSDLIGRRLREILKAKQDMVLVGIPRMFPGMPERKVNFWRKYHSTKFISLYDPDRLYGSAFITRPDSAPHIDTSDYFNMVKDLWKDKRVLLLQGEGRQFLKAKPDLFETAKSYGCFYGPNFDAFSRYTEIRDICRRKMEGFDLLVVSLGATATILAYDLGLEGIRTLDLGHLGMFYAHIHPKARGYDGSPYPGDGK